MAEMSEVYKDTGRELYMGGRGKGAGMSVDAARHIAQVANM